MRLPVQDTAHLRYNIVGNHLASRAAWLLVADNEIPYIVNKQGDGQCPLDSRLNEVTDLSVALDTIRHFYECNE